VHIEESGADPTPTVEGELYQTQASVDTTGDWVHVDDPHEPIPGGPIPIGPFIGDVEVAAPTDDTDGDGRLDTVVVTDALGDTLIFTDADEDGDADYATEITGDGHITVTEHTQDGDWTVIERGHLDEHGAYHEDAEATGWITDPRTGNWVRGPAE
jgi:hypothetical protein